MADELVGQVLLLDVVALEVVREPVADADAVVLHPPVAGAAQVVRARGASRGASRRRRRRSRRARPVRLGRRRDIDRRLGERVLRLGQPDPVQRLGGRDGDLERARIGVADVLGRAMISRRAMNLGSSPAAIIEASQ